MKLGLGLGVNSITSQKIGAGFTGILDEYSGAAAAYSVRRLSSSYTDGLIRVRRSSDDTEQDIGFDANGDLDSTALLAFVNASYTNYQSDFSSTGQDDLEETNGTGAIDQSVGGVDEAYLFTNTATGSCYPEVRNLLDVGQTTRIQLDYYIPSGQDCDMVILRGGSVEYTRGTTVGSWDSIDITAVVDRDDLFLFLGDGGSLSLGSTGNELYLKNIVITQTTADGAVTTFYDQSGNGNNATNSTASEQPLVVSAGTLVEENGKAAVDFDGVDDMLQKDFDPDIAQPLTLFHVRRYRSNGTFCAIGYDNSTNTGYADINIFSDFRSYYGSYLGTTTQDTEQGLWYSLANGASSEVGLDGASAETGNAGTGSLKLLSIGSAFGAFDAPINTQEIIIFDSDQSANRTGIETNINDHFDIYS